VDENPTLEDIEGLRAAIDTMSEYCSSGARENFRGVAERSFYELNDTLLQHIEQTYGVGNSAVLQIIKQRVDELEKSVISNAVKTQPSPAGWYSDPAGSGQWRYFDGSAWTDHYAPP
jgi:hypothetical protein